MGHKKHTHPHDDHAPGVNHRPEPGACNEMHPSTPRPFMAADPEFANRPSRKRVTFARRRSWQLGRAGRALALRHLGGGYRHQPQRGAAKASVCQRGGQGGGKGAGWGGGGEPDRSTLLSSELARGEGGRGGRVGGGAHPHRGGLLAETMTGGSGCPRRRCTSRRDLRSLAPLATWLAPSSSRDAPLRERAQATAAAERSHGAKWPLVVFSSTSHSAKLPRS
jgi:hypothetical protein